MKRILFLAAFLILSGILSAQTVENIQVEQDGEKLNIHYRIGGSTSDQLYFVTLTCSIDKGPVFEPKSVIGDVGANIRGGKSFNTVVWDVFKDVEEVGSAEFFVKVDLIRDDGRKEIPAKVEKSSVSGPTNYRKIFVGFEGSLWWHPIGINFGTLGNWGGYGSFRYGGYWAEYDIYGDFLYDGYLAALTAGVTKRILNKEKIRLHGYTGIGAGDYLDEFEFEAGVITVFKNRINVNMGFSVNRWYGEFTYGVGVLF